MRNLETLGATVLSVGWSFAFKQKSNSGDVEDEWSKVMIDFAIAERAMVAGDNTGAGAADVVWVCDMTDRDLSRKAIRACDVTPFSPEL